MGDKASTVGSPSCLLRLVISSDSCNGKADAAQLAVILKMAHFLSLILCPNTYVEEAGGVWFGTM